MNKANGFIVLHRKILDWEWYSDINTFRLFVHLLLTANHEDGRFQGRVIKRGQVVTSLSELSTNTSLSFQQTRTALEHLISTNEVTNESTPNYRVITIVNYDKYQDKQQSSKQADNKRLTNKSTNDQQTDQQQYNNINNETIKQGKQIECTGTAKRFTPPTLDDISAYCRERGNDVDPERFLDYYTSNGWRVGKNPMKDWKAAVRTWEKGDNNGGQHSKHGGKAQESDWPDYSFLRDTVINL